MKTLERFIDWMVSADSGWIQAAIFVLGMFALSALIVLIAEVL